MNKPMSKGLISVLPFIFFVGCQNNPYKDDEIKIKKVNKREEVKPIKLKGCVLPNKNEKAPEWFCFPDKEVDFNIKDVEFNDTDELNKKLQDDIVKGKARDKITQIFKNRVKNLILKKAIKKNVFGQEEKIEKLSNFLSKGIYQKTFKAEKIIKRHYSKDGHLYAIIGVDPNTEKAIISQSIIKSFKEKPELWDFMR